MTDGFYCDECVRVITHDYDEWQDHVRMHERADALDVDDYESDDFEHWDFP